MRQTKSLLAIEAKGENGDEAISTQRGEGA